MFDNLPLDIKYQILNYLPKVILIQINKHFFYKYHKCLNIHNNSLELYIRDTIKLDHSFIFKQLLIEKNERWLRMKKYVFKNLIFKTYVDFILFYSLQQKSYKCFNLIKKYNNTKLCEKGSKNDKIINTRWINWI